jgi:hypothetical protein
MINQSSGIEIKLIGAFLLTLAAISIWKSCSDNIAPEYRLQATATITDCYPCTRQYCFQYTFISEEGDSCVGRFTAAFYDVVEKGTRDCRGETVLVSYDRRNCASNFVAEY